MLSTCIRTVEREGGAHSNCGIREDNPSSGVYCKVSSTHSMADGSACVVSRQVSEKSCKHFTIERPSHEPTCNSLLWVNELINIKDNVCTFMGTGT